MDAQLAKEFQLGLPHYASFEERKLLVETFIREQLLPRGMIVDYAIHAPNRAGDERNWHAHLLTTLRPVANGNLSPLKDREACSREMIAKWREAWADLQNRFFERSRLRDKDGRPLRTDHRSYAKRGIDREPTMHMGVHATAVERKGTGTEIGERNRDIAAANNRREISRRRAQLMSRNEAARELSFDERPGRDHSGEQRSDGPGRDDWDP